MTKQSTRLFALSAGLLVTTVPFLAHYTSFAEPQKISYPDAPLPKSDARAKLDPKLVGVPDVVQPKLTSRPPRSSGVPREVSFNLRTKKVKISPLSVSRRSVAQAFQPGSAGRNNAVKKEPRTRGRSVIGTDDRIRITSTTSYPWRVMTKVYATFRGGVAGCSGALIAAKYVLTAAHCVYSRTDGWSTRVEVIPGLSGTYKPYGSAFATGVRAYTNWTQSGDSNYDFALITLDRPIGNTTGWFGYGNFSPINGVTGHLAGYPGDKGGVNLYYHSGSISGSTSQRVSYQIDTAGGQSGSNVYRFYTPSGGASGRYVFGVHTLGGSTSNSATRIDSAKYNNLRSWIDSGT